MWVRGLKQGAVLSPQGKGQSHPMWVRGLKLEWAVLRLWLYAVAPHVGAWIETCLRHHAPSEPWSHPMWVRGLKHQFGETYATS